MTKKELEAIGIFSTNSKLKKREFFIPLYGEYIIPEYYTITDIFEMIYNKGFENGIVRGKELKVIEIKNCLNITTEEFL